MNVLLVAFGSYGDVHPFVGMGLALRARGHATTVIANPYFSSLIRSVGIEFIPIGTEADYRKIAADPACWKRLRAARTLLPWAGKMVRPLYELLAARINSHDTVVVASSLALGARVIHDRLGTPLATIHLSPSIFMSVVEPPSIGGIVFPKHLAPWIGKAQLALVDRACDSLVAPALNSLRQDLGLAPVNRVMTQYLHSPQRVIGLFPSWYAEPAPDWPRQVRITGFPLYDESDLEQLSPELSAFIDSGDPPIVFTPGSAMWSAGKFFRESARACDLMGRRGLLLSRHYDHIPRRLSRNVRHVSYAPFSQLLRRCAAIVHHGGIGTSAQALRAGIPQLIVPFAFDQHDNAARLVALGVARKCEPRSYRSGLAAALLGEILDSASFQARCRSVAPLFADHPRAVEQTCHLIEQLCV